MPERNVVFVSHATPEDNAFTLWLGAKLSAIRYEVWADILRLSGGEDWARKLESAIREKAIKVLLVGNPISVAKQGVRNEIQIATDVGRNIGDETFVTPLKLARFDAPFLIVRAQYIDFEKGWTAGLQELLETLENTYKIPKVNKTQLSTWTNLQLINGKQVAEKSEPLISNWLETRRLPDFIYYLPLTASQVHSKHSVTIRGSISEKASYLHKQLAPRINFQ
jgi:TIR domain